MATKTDANALFLREILDSAHFNQCWTDVTNLTENLDGIKTVSNPDGYRFKDEKERWVSNSGAALDIMISILEPRNPHPSLVTAFQLRDLTKEARETNRYLDVSNVQDDGSGCVFIEANDKGFPLNPDGCWCSWGRHWCATYEQYLRYVQLRHMRPKS